MHTRSPRVDRFLVRAVAYALVLLVLMLVATYARDLMIIVLGGGITVGLLIWWGVSHGGADPRRDDSEWH